jgi:hypothetical protein
MSKKLFRKHCIDLNKVRILLSQRTTKDGTKIILCPENEVKVDRALAFIDKADKILISIE